MNSNNLNNIIIERDYGKIRLSLKEQMSKKNANIYQMTVATGLSHSTIKAYYNNEVVRLDTDIIAKFCYALNCDINDIIKYERVESSNI